MFFRLLGWLFASSGDKAPSFSEIFQALGVSINISLLHQGFETIGNTESRRKELVSFLEQVLKQQKLTRVDALRLRGRLQFAAGNVFGRIAKSALSIVIAHAYHPCLRHLTVLRRRPSRCKHLLLEGKPRKLRPSAGEVWYTDGCLL